MNSVVSAPTPTRSPLVRAFMVVAVVEAFTWIGLLVGMYFKYIAESTEMGVKIFGPLHGAAFVSYVVITVLVARHLKWSILPTLLALVASVPPCMTVVFEWWAKRQGLLDEPPTAV